MKKNELIEELSKAGGKLYEVSEALRSLNGTAFVNDDPRGKEDPPVDVRLACYDWIVKYYNICGFIIGHCAEIADELAQKLDNISAKEIKEDKEE